MHRRGFAMPLVVLMSLVAALLVSVALDRSMAQALTVNRQIDRYATHHFNKGLEVLIDSFARAMSGRSLPEVLDQSGLAMRLITDDGVGLRVSFFDAQDTLLEAFDGFGRDDRMMGEGALVRLIEAVGMDEIRENTRTFGPMSVSINSSSETVLHCALDAALLGEGVERAQAALLQAKRSAANPSAMTREELQIALDSAGLEPPMRARVERIVTAQPVIWRFVVEPDIAPSSARGASVRYEGLAIIAPPNADRGANVSKGGGSVMEIRKIEEEPAAATRESRN